MNGFLRQLSLIVVPLAVLTLVAPRASAQEQAREPAAGAPQESLQPRITLIELTPHIAVNDAATLIEAEDYAGAIELLDGFIANRPEPVAEAFYLLGVAHYKLGNTVQALPAAERAVTLADDAPASWIELVAALLKQREDYRAAIPWFERLIEMEPGNRLYWLELSLAYENVDDYRHALATMRLAHTAGLLTDDADYRRLSDLLVHQGIPVEAAVVLEQALDDQIVRADEAAYTKLGTAWFMAGEFDEAVFPLENAARLGDTGDGYVRLAMAHVERQDWAAAIAALHAGMGRGSLSDEGRANLLMGVALYAQGKFAEAQDWLTMAAEEPAHRPAAESYLEAIAARTAAAR
jgi:tetratricopeptide (TPR) repeat protein